MLMANKNIEIAIRKAVEKNCDNDAMIIAKAASIVRRDLLAMINLRMVAKKSQFRSLCCP